jgi:hypothetical protein
MTDTQQRDPFGMPPWKVALVSFGILVGVAFVALVIFAVWLFSQPIELGLWSTKPRMPGAEALGLRGQT